VRVAAGSIDATEEAGELVLRSVGNRPCKKDNWRRSRKRDKVVEKLSAELELFANDGSLRNDVDKITAESSGPPLPS
jgi:hypothetical protein